jgi:GNAT superfamily N-acetyltransferase
MLIRQANEADLHKAGRLWLAMVTEMRPDFTPNVEWWRKIARDSMRNGTYFMFVADEGGKIVGFLDWFLFPEPSTGQTHLVGQHLFLDPSFRGSGIGRELYEKTLEIGTGMGIKIFELFCFSNEQPYWEKRGFAPLRTLMRKEIKSNV